MSREKKISASEINRYVYCPYQWYYSKVYGQAELRRLQQEQLEIAGLEDSYLSNFKKGLDFHDKYILRKNIRWTLKILFWSILGIFILVIVLYLRQY